MSDETHMARFWDERARENAFFFVDDRLDYGRADEERFWRGGEEVLGAMLDTFDLDLRPLDVVVEIGCGVGRLTRPIARAAGRVVAIDVSSEMLALARSQNDWLEGVEWMLGDGRTLAGVGDASADVCLSYVTFQHIPDPAVTLGYVAEMGRVLRDGGFALFQVSNDAAVHRARRDLRGCLRALVGRGPRGTRDPAWTGAQIDLPALRAAATDAGLDVQGVIYEGTQFCLVHAVRTNR